MTTASLVAVGLGLAFYVGLSYAGERWGFFAIPAGIAAAAVAVALIFQ